MNCPKCKNEIADNQLRCNFCGVKVKMLCPNCRALNKFGAKRCTSCGVELIRYCPSCKAANLPNMKKCRKCGAELNQSTAIANKVSETSSQVSPKKEDVVIRPLPKNIKKPAEESPAKSPISGLSYKTKDIPPTQANANIPIEKPVEPQKDLTLDDVLAASAYELKQEEKLEVKTEDVKVSDSVVESVQEPQKNEPEIKEDSQKIEGASIEEEKEEKEQGIKYYSQMEAMQKVISLVKTPATKHIIALNGEEGIGKSTVFDFVNQYLQKDNIIALTGKCSPLTQISTFGYFQDMFIRMLSLPAFCANVDNFIKHNKKIFENIFHLLTNDEISDFINILYPSKTGSFEKIIKNKDKTFAILEKVFDSIAEKNRFVLVVDNFDLIDGFSYEFLSHLVDNNFFNEQTKLLLAYKDRKVVQSYFASNKVDESIYETIYLAKISEKEVSEYIDNFVNNPLEQVSADLKKTIHKNSFGNAAYVEQAISYLRDSGYLSLKNNNKFTIDENKLPQYLPSGIVEAVNLRLKNQVALPPLLKNILFASAIMGYKFDSTLITSALGIEEDQMVEATNRLQDMKLIVPVSQYAYEFKSLSLWRYIYEEAKNDELFKEINEKLLEFISQFVLSSTSLKAVIAKNLLDDTKGIDVWRETAEYSAYTGDINLYVIALKQCLKVMGENEAEKSSDFYNEICEKIGKLSYRTSPEEALEYLSNAISAAKKTQDYNKVVELCSYLVSSCYSIGNYYGVVEAVNLVVDAVESEVDDLSLALIKSRKIKALFFIGNCEETINTATNDVIGILEEALSRQSNDTHYMTLIYESWLETNLMMANAYSMQGNEKSIEIIDNVIEIMQINKLENKYYRTKADISKAFAYTVIGQMKKSFETLDMIANNYKDDMLNSEFLSHWNLIYIINKIMTNQAANLREELFSLATFANNTNDYFSKNIIKTILGHIIQKDGNLSKSLDIFNDQITYFAKERIATGALLGWYLISQVTLTVEGADRALDIATKALEVAQNPKINNFNFIIYLQKLIAEIYMIKGDLDATKMYLEKSLLIAKQFGLKQAQIELYKTFGKYYEEVISKIPVEKEKLRENNAQAAVKMYNLALNVANEIEEEGFIIIVNQDKAAFKTYCQLNEIFI